MELLKEIDFDTIVVQAPDLVTANIEGEKVMMSIKKGKYFGLDSIGSRIWEFIEKPHTVREVVSELQKEYDVEEKDYQQDVLAFLCKLKAQGLVEVD